MKPGTIYMLVQELRRRRIFRGIIVYGASTLVLLEAADIIANSFGFDGAPKWFVWVLGVGFMISLPVASKRPNLLSYDGICTIMIDCHGPINKALHLLSIYGLS